MLDQAVFTAALGLAAPWYVATVDLRPALGRLHLGLAYREDLGFVCPRCGTAGCPAELTRPRTWQHAGFFGYRAFLHTRLPDLGCERCGIIPAAVTWERVGFVLLSASHPALAAWQTLGTDAAAAVPVTP